MASEGILIATGYLYTLNHPVFTRGRVGGGVPMNREHEPGLNETTSLVVYSVSVPWSNSRM
jgi:hypothetical protein